MINIYVSKIQLKIKSDFFTMNFKESNISTEIRFHHQREKDCAQTVTSIKHKTFTPPTHPSFPIIAQENACHELSRELMSPHCCCKHQQLCKVKNTIVPYPVSTQYQIILNQACILISHKIVLTNNIKSDHYRKLF